MPLHRDISMDSFDKTFAALSDRVRGLAVPDRCFEGAPPIAVLIERVNAARLRYEPRLRR